MIWFSLFIPFLCSCVFFVWYKKTHELTSEQTLLILLSPTVIVAVIVGLMYFIMLENNLSDIEYLNYHYTKIYHEDEWNERVWVTKTRTVRHGKHHHTETYRVQETRHHPDRWIGYLNDGNGINISRGEYKHIKELWNVNERFIDMHRHYYTIDGDAHECVWDGNINTLKPYVKEHHYRNVIIGSETAFKFNEITKEEAKTLGLYDYPSLEKHNEQNPIIGCRRFITSNDIKQFKRLNAINGYRKEITTFLLIYPNSSASIVEDQRSYWQGGNKNEFIICVGIDSLTNKVQWSQCFSWLDDITMEVECRNFINNQDKLNATEISKWVGNHLHLWKRKEFNDFSYLNVNLTDGQEIAILWTVIILSLLALGISVIVNKE